jgi:hypothetical protein
MVQRIGSNLRMISLTMLFFLPIGVSVWHQNLKEWCDSNHVYDSPRTSTQQPTRIASHNASH